MQIVGFQLDCGAYSPGQLVVIVVRVSSPIVQPATVALSIIHLDELVDRRTHTVVAGPTPTEVELTWSPPLHAPRGYGFELTLLDPAGDVADTRSGAFDVLPHWTTFPRYGFLCDFAPARLDVEQTIGALAQFHINGLQFYDWQYRHDTLLAPAEEYQDPLNRTLSLITIRAFIEAAHDHGIAAMPYLAVYAASADYWRRHPAAALYDAEQRPLAFGDDFLGLMNPAPGSAWSKHLIGECMLALRALPYDGLHVDQYGEPKVAFDSNGQPVDLPAAFVAFIAALKQAAPRATVLFNAVGDWPSDALAVSQQDFVYIEIWPPCVTYAAVGEVVQRARSAAQGKPCVIALYLPTDRPANIRLTDALLFSHGATRIELGEAARLLADPYFPKHEPLDAGLRMVLHRYYDFAVRYGEWLGPAAGVAVPIAVTVPAGVIALARRTAETLTVCLVNFCGLGEARWDEAHPAPDLLSDFPLLVAIEARVSNVMWASPDQEHLDLAVTAWRRDGGIVEVAVPQLQFWTMVTFFLD